METNSTSCEIKRCPKTGRIISGGPPEPQVPKKQKWWKKVLLPFLGLASLIWFLVRVIPKPSRATYPCMRAAAPMAASFVTWLTGIFGFAALIKKSKEHAKRARYISAISMFAIGLVIAVAFSINGTPGSAKAFAPPDAPNTPMGVAKGILPGRVTWTRNLNATTWNGTTGYWWEPGNTNQTLIDGMISDSVRSLTGTSSDAAAWDSVFKYFNQNHGKGNMGYSTNEKIAMKINCNNTRDSHAQTVNNINPSPQLILSVLRQLINTVGVPQQNITIYDASRYITNNIYTYVKNEFPNVVFVDQNGGDGRVAKQWSDSVIKYSKANYCGDRVPTVVAQADYLIDMPIMKAHPLAGMTLSAKNHYGTLNGIDHDLARPYNTYNPFVDFMGDKDLGGKTLINILDGLYAAKHSDVVPEKWKSKPFNNSWPASVFMSLDQVALDSVGFDFINAEMGDRMMANSDSYLHEEAMADNPPSGTVYAPDGVRLQSLGVHEHWNNSDEKKYTRNLGTGNGIELVAIGQTAVSQTDAPVFSPAGGNYSTAQNVTISCTTAGATIRYTTDGSTPTNTSTVYTGPIKVSENTTIKAYASGSGMADSAVSSATYTIAPVISAIPGKIEAEDYNAMSNVQTQGCSEGTLNIGWIDTNDWMDYDVNVQTAGTYTVQFRISSPNTTGQIQLRKGDEILSTVAVPTTGGWQNWQTVSSKVNLSAGRQTLRVFVLSGGWNFNWLSFDTSSEQVPSQVAAPVFTPAGGIYASAQNVTITCATEGALIRYTTDGTTPSETNGLTYTSPFTVSSDTRVQAIAFKADMTASNTASASYIISTQPVNLALNKQAFESDHEGNYLPSAAFDGNVNTRWSSAFSDPQWIYVDLGQSMTVSGVRLNWENAYGKTYIIQVSNDANQWDDVFPQNNGTGKIENITFSPVSARYVRMYGLTRNTPYGYSLWEFEVY